MLHYRATSVTDMPPIKQGCLYGLTKKITRLIGKLSGVKNSTITLEYKGRKAEIGRKIIMSRIKSSVRKTNKTEGEWFRQERRTFLSTIINKTIDGQPDKAKHLDAARKREVFGYVRRELKIKEKLDPVCAQSSIKQILYGWRETDNIIAVLYPELKGITPATLRLQKENEIKEKVVNDIAADLCYTVFGIPSSELIKSTEKAIDVVLSRAAGEKACSAPHAQMAKKSGFQRRLLIRRDSVKLPR
ncbi:hypothetical protein [[Erwinia] mediterraneensis]|uniref:hypothetical protein n=1 Tax=[Erwinia] mediterraneensis TaxID=2161819 RepID=UPI001030A4C3|nr:hypothetical protein [[Erwinia] mediterraneensis]